MGWQIFSRYNGGKNRAKNNIDSLFAHDVIDDVSGLEYYSFKKIDLINNFLIDAWKFLKTLESRDAFVTYVYLSSTKFLIKETTSMALVSKVRDIIEMDLTSNPRKKLFIKFVSAQRVI